MRGTSRHYAEPELSREWSWKKQWLVYTGLFVVTALLVFAAFFVYQKTLLKGNGNVDGLMQHYPSYTKLKRVLAQGGESWSWDVGLGASFFDTFKGKLTNPLTYLLLAFPQKYLDLAYDFVTILRQYLAGVAFLIFGREVKLTTEQNVLGAFAYAFSGWAIIATLTQGTFNNSMMLFPILIMGAERILKGKSPLVFIVAEVLFLASTVLWAYIAGIFVILYFIVRYFHFYGKNGALRATLPPEQPAWKSFAGRFGGFIGDGLIGLMISAIFVESIIYTTTSAVINSDYDANQGVFYSLKTYFAMPTALVSLNEVHEAYSAVFAGLLVTALMPMIIWTVRKKKSTAGIFAIFCPIIGLFPLTGKILNGFGVSALTIDRLDKASKDIFPLRNIRAGHKYTAFIHEDSLYAPHLDYLVYERNVAEYVVFGFHDDSVSVRTGEKQFTVRRTKKSATINSSLWGAIMEEHLPYALAAEMEDIYQWTVDFFGIQKGDNFTVIYDERFIDDSISAGIGRIWGAKFCQGGKEYYAIPFRQGRAGPLHFSPVAQNKNRTPKSPAFILG